MNSQQYVWMAVVIIGIIGGIEIGYAISNMSYQHRMLGGFGDHDGWNHYAGYMMQSQGFRQQVYSSMFDSSKFREEMSEYLAQNPQMMYDWCYTMMNNPHAMQTMMNNPQHLQMMQKMMGNFTAKGGMGMMGNMSGMGNMMHH